MRKISVLLFFFLLMNIYGAAYAELKTIDVNQHCKIDDNDSRNEIIHICSIEADKSVLGQAVAYISAVNDVKQYQFSGEELNAYTAAVLKIKNSNKKWLDAALTLTATANIDSDQAGKLLARIKSDTALQNLFKEQYRQKDELVKTLAAMRAKLKSANLYETEDLRKERNEVIRKIESIEIKRSATIDEIIKKSADAKKRAAVRMAMKEIKSLLGDSDAQTYENYPAQGGKTFYVWYYGYTRIYFDGGYVAMIR